uniref:Stabilin 1 n=1 Tax=Periophthalmus magnuspinnatus TaxID=409849 RepID=A0A3B3ZVP4_9GOBI
MILYITFQDSQNTFHCIIHYTICDSKLFFKSQLPSGRRMEVRLLFTHMHTSHSQTSWLKCLAEGHNDKFYERSLGFCRYQVTVGGRQLELSGCRTVCGRRYFRSKCCPQFWGIPCIACPSWSGKTCNYRGSCSDGQMGNGTCICDDKFSGFACNECKNPNAYGVDCDKECDCEHGICNKGPEGDGQCFCQPPYTGKRCDQLSSGCRSCPPFSYCRGDGDSALCDCLPGHRRTNEGKCLIVCTARDCDRNAECLSQGSKITCTCKTDYEGNGRVCVPKNPCNQNNGGCPLNSTVCVFSRANKVSPGLDLFRNPHIDLILYIFKYFWIQGKHASFRHTEVTLLCECSAEQIGDGWRCYGNLMEQLLELDRTGDHQGNLTATITLFGQLHPVIKIQCHKYLHVIGENIHLEQFFWQNCGASLPLGGPGPLTVFVPTNQAIDAARDGSILYMLNSVITAFPDLINRIFFLLQLTSDELAVLPQIRTMANQFIRVSGQLVLGDKSIHLVSTNFMASNGIIHMIDRLLVPPTIVPIMPHRCDIVENKVTVGPCVRCSYLFETSCPVGSMEMVPSCIILYFLLYLKRAIKLVCVF